jgi:preprotein translocase subunit SecE
MGKEKETTKKPVAKKESKKLGFQKYFRGVVSEMKKVTWPTRKELINSTAVVLVFILISAIAVGIVDLGLGSLLKLIS